MIENQTAFVDGFGIPRSVVIRWHPSLPVPKGLRNPELIEPIGLGNPELPVCAKHTRLSCTKPYNLKHKKNNH